MFVQAKSSNFDDKHNICCTLDKTLPKMKPFEDVLEFIEKNWIRKALTDTHKCYRAHVESFWNAARYDEDEKTIYSAVKLKDDDGKDIDVEVKFKVEDVRRVLEFKDQDDDPIQVSERLCKVLWFRMRYAGTMNDPSFNNSNLSMSYKFLVHSVIRAWCHRKGGYDVSIGFIMCILTCLLLNRPYNISQVIFNHMVDNVKGEKFLQYPRFVQMLLDDQIKDLPKEAEDELVLEHMDNETLKRL
ncbi:hypothetical protein HanRHA438_Chr05g0208321 [Helianthus annuus]|uniref:Uncharacterized protein n=1 Tax=Helianthus annuus TaxID=4232 RepID=A0A9K3NL41_HELAN|nr:hypothetical protein HanXRQr2_Chr05g0198691 [Helianthus annuus]KAJ0569181.1 hypothetical protein HanHA300_Chr05g0163141 [Helianthus annuus]KAJ0583477.1 hypothetical protein HanHA89_Chr05g0177031 [Helianthus annuus]KAJ0746211.1 hypothetical protein HanOQP8_Chr05g0174941 [Helianthus annuus]KAJ0749215.1 hypothetical protein HanLR1_Chr05g0167241 [Helianthus annuus]